MRATAYPYSKGMGANRGGTSGVRKRLYPLISIKSIDEITDRNPSSLY
jgi:hypothetical protein